MPCSRLKELVRVLTTKEDSKTSISKFEIRKRNNRSQVRNLVRDASQEYTTSISLLVHTSTHFCTSTKDRILNKDKESMVKDFSEKYDILYAIYKG